MLIQFTFRSFSMEPSFDRSIDCFILQKTSSVADLFLGLLLEHRQCNQTQSGNRCDQYPYKGSFSSVRGIDRFVAQRNILVWDLFQIFLGRLFSALLNRLLGGFFSRFRSRFFGALLGRFLNRFLSRLLGGFLGRLFSGFLCRLFNCGGNGNIDIGDLIG